MMKVFVGRRKCCGRVVAADMDISKEAENALKDNGYLVEQMEEEEVKKLLLAYKPLQTIEDARHAASGKQKLRPMSEAPRDGTAIIVYYPKDLGIPPIIIHRGARFPDYRHKVWKGAGADFGDDLSQFIGWLPLPEVEE